MKHSQNDAGRPQQLRDTGDGLLGHGGVQVIQGIPKQHSIEGSRLILQIGLQETRRAAFGSSVERFTQDRILAQRGLFFIEKVFPSAQNVFGRDTEVALDKEIQGGLPGGSQIEQSPAAEAVEIPEKFFQAIGYASGSLFGGAGRDWRPCTGTRRSRRERF